MLQYQLLPQKKVLKIVFEGPIDEQAVEPLGNLHREAERYGECIFNFDKIAYVNSLGVRAWISFLRAFKEGKNVYFEECRSEILSQFNSVKGFLGGGKVTSFYGDFECPQCEMRTLPASGCGT